MRLIKAISLLGLTLSFGAQAMAENPFSVRVEGGLTGYGGAVLYEVNPYVSLALGYNGGRVNWRDNIKINKIKYDLDMDNNTTFANVIIRPWGNNNNTWISSFYTIAGIAYIGDNYKLHRYFKPGEKRPSQINKYVPKNVGIEASGYLDYGSNLSPYVGLGISPKFNKNWGAFFEIGTSYTGEAEVHLTHVNGRNVGSIGVKTDYRLDNETIFKWHPVAKLGITYSF
ncbi:hypothetical protein B9T31_13920 [Acinetobacter sp. ANC 4558]|uniref:hypothetical protein n=1 Tax=Acinetobacter sp. ANC 4558 TaxID=1977876 RepID=UPI000A35A133|nr:hypothetical protein [Acinetobacter sp. ANC 4558]OTG83183.1 hypothetical protein B9T31_13920 [Acinetobacter sp. ANC 4558]